MNAIRMLRRLESDTLTLPELRPLIGHKVEIIVLDALPPDTSTGDGLSRYQAFFDLAGKDVVDPDAYRELRATSLV